MGLMEVLMRVLFFRVITATYIAATQAHRQVNPARAAAFAFPAGQGRVQFAQVSDLVQMQAGRIHEGYPCKSGAEPLP